MDKSSILDTIKRALREDLDIEGDITSKVILNNKNKIVFEFNSREEMVVCGIPILQELFAIYEDEIDYIISQEEGVLIESNTTIIRGQSSIYTLFSIERVALNFLQHLSGIATITKSFIQKIQHTNVVIRDTRKTTPGLRALEKYAVHVGGGNSYRYSLSDQILIKDNHIAACNGDIAASIRQVKELWPERYIAVECDNLLQVEIAFECGVDLILLDNMLVLDIKRAVEIRSDSKTKLEASGGITLQNVQEIAETGVDYISIGMLTHSAPNKDIGLDIYHLKNT